MERQTFGKVSVLLIETKSRRRVSQEGQQQLSFLKEGFHPKIIYPGLTTTNSENSAEWSDYRYRNNLADQKQVIPFQMYP